MNTRPILPFCALLLTGLVVAQDKTVRGEVEDVRNAAGVFFLGCTKIPLVSNTVDLAALERGNQQLIMQVVNVGTPTAPVLDVLSTVTTTKVMDMGNLRLGNTDRWEVNADPGSFAMAFAGLSSHVGFTPVGAFGTLLLGPDAGLMRSGIVNGQGQFQFDFTMPNLPALLGTSVTSQALASVGGRHVLSNPDCRVIASN